MNKKEEIKITEIKEMYDRLQHNHKFHIFKFWELLKLVDNCIKNKLVTKEELCKLFTEEEFKYFDYLIHKDRADTIDALEAVRNGGIDLNYKTIYEYLFKKSVDIVPCAEEMIDINIKVSKDKFDYIYIKKQDTFFEELQSIMDIIFNILVYEVDDIQKFRLQFNYAFMTVINTIELAKKEREKK
jgi:hypothetical protein